MLSSINNLGENFCMKILIYDIVFRPEELPEPVVIAFL
jgi:hypothetical protein